MTRRSRVIGDEQCWRCTKCRDWKPASMFRNDPRKQTGLSSHCSACCFQAYSINNERQRQKRLEKAKERPKKRTYGKHPFSKPNKKPPQRVQKPKPAQTTPRPPKPPRKPQNAKRPAIRRTCLASTSTLARKTANPWCCARLAAGWDVRGITRQPETSTTSSCTDSARRNSMNTSMV